MILNDQLQRPIFAPPFVTAKTMFVITETSTRISGSKTGNVIMKQFSGPLPFSLFERIDDLPVGFLYSRQVISLSLLRTLTRAQQLSGLASPRGLLRL
jgi:hypothetical protein